MKFAAPLLEGILLRRYKRFLADIELSDGQLVTAHTANTGRMEGCAIPGSRVWLRDSANPKRKYPFTWELVETRPGVITGINTGLSNLLVREAIEQGVVSECQGYSRLHTEVPYGAENSRIDLLLENDSGPRCYIEVKNVTLVNDGIARFPDAVSSRGTRHLRELSRMVAQGHRAIIFYCVQRHDASQVQPADAIDPVYGRTLREVLGQGVEALAYRAEVSPESITLKTPLPVICP